MHGVEGLKLQAVILQNIQATGGAGWLPKIREREIAHLYEFLIPLVSEVYVPCKNTTE